MVILLWYNNRDRFFYHLILLVPFYTFVLQLLYRIYSLFFVCMICKSKSYLFLDYLIRVGLSCTPKNKKLFNPFTWLSLDFIFLIVCICLTWLYVKLDRLNFIVPFSPSLQVTIHYVCLTFFCTRLKTSVGYP